MTDKRPNDSPRGTDKRQVWLLAAVLIAGCLLAILGDGFLYQGDMGLEHTAEDVEPYRHRAMAFWITICTVGIVYVVARSISWTTRGARWSVVE